MGQQVRPWCSLIALQFGGDNIGLNLLSTRRANVPSNIRLAADTEIHLCALWFPAIPGAA